MRRSIQTQILLPFAVTVTAAVAIIAATSSYLAVQQAEQRIRNRISGVARTLSGLSVPFNQTVLRQMQRLSGVEFIALDRSGRVIAGTVSDIPDRVLEEIANSLPPRSPRAERMLAELPVVTLGRTAFLADRVVVAGPSGRGTLLTLFPEADWQAGRAAALWPPLVVGAMTVVFVIGISAFLARSFGRRVQDVQHLLAAIAAGSPAIDPPSTAPRDELDDLVVSAAQLSGELHQLQRTVQRTERVRLLGQLAGGLAHQLRNAVTGARLAVQLHRKRCHLYGVPADTTSDSGEGQRAKVADDSLNVALRQLEVTEHQIQRLLSLTRQKTEQPVVARLSDLVEGIAQLIRPNAEHARVGLTVHVDVHPDAEVADAVRLRAAVLNLLLNAIEAAGAGGSVDLSVSTPGVCHQFRVTDSGPGPGQEVAETLCEPFVTSKPQGVGLGLALVDQVAQESGGRLTWARVQQRTVFELTIPMTGSHS